MKNMLVVLCLATAVFTFTQSAVAQWKIPTDAPLLTRWAKDVSPDKPLPEYPRPQMVRDAWMNLNGLWEYKEAAENETPPFGVTLPGIILVPYPIESALSGVMKHVGRLWYRRTVTLPEQWEGKKVMLNFGAVDWEAKVFVNGHAVGLHRGGYDPFSCDITAALKSKGVQEIVVGVFDPSDQGDQPRGKQVLKPGGIMYTPTTGIWQTVWLEPVATASVTGMVIVPNTDAGTVSVTTVCTGEGGTYTTHVEAYEGTRKISEDDGKPGSEMTLAIPSAKLWSPETPFLYDLRVQLLEQGKEVDAVKSYFGMRKIEIARDANGIHRMLLNGKFSMQLGPLDQGFWPDGLYTAPTDEALRYDIEMTKKLGFNMARKHVKVEPDRWYYWADKLGLLVWQDMPSGNNRTDDAKIEFETELSNMIVKHYNHPSIIMWVVFNEGWGQYDTERLTAWVKQLDPSRLVNNASGWTDRKAGDVYDIHHYPQPKMPARDPNRALALGEFGGLGLAVDGHTWKKEHWGYQGMADIEQLTSRYEEFLRRVYSYRDTAGLSAAIYTQTTDVEVECNGLMTYDRAMIKPLLDRVYAANTGDFSRMAPLPVIKTVVPSSEQEGRQWRYTLDKPADNWFGVSFDDSGWKIGPAGFGSRETEDAVVRTEWKTNDIWLRTEANIPEAQFSDVHLRLHHDDEAEVYINGVLAGSYGRYTTEYEEFPITPAGKRAIKQGKNLIAVHCRQNKGGQYIDVGIVDVLVPEGARQAK
jgi:hypothetical protein